LAYLLIFFTSSVLAEWTQIASNDDVIFFIENSKIRKDGNFRKVWNLQNLKVRHKTGFLSLRTRDEFDCKGERHRFLTVGTYSDRFAGGEQIASINIVSDWVEVPPHSHSELVLKLVCAKY
jgi:hypothetical protein